MTILGISVGTARTGVCVLREGQLLDRHIHNYPLVWSEEKLNDIIAQYRRYILRHGVNAIVVKVPPLQRHTNALLQLMKRIEALAIKHACEFDLTTKSEMKHRIGARSTTELINYTRHLYPELDSLYKRGKPSDYQYYKKLFEAVLAAHIFKERLQAKQ